MDCKRFRKNHLGYLDDTLPGTDMAAAQRHLMGCEPCAAHDALVRRSLMAVRSLPTLEPSADFQARLRAKLAQCKAEQAGEFGQTGARGEGRAVQPPTDTMLPLFPDQARSARPVRAVMAVAAGAALAAVAWQSVREATAPELRMAPVIASTPALPETPYVSAELLQAMATGNPVWSAALVVDDLPVSFVSTNYSFDTGQ